MINSNVALDLKAESGVPYWKARGADTWNPFINKSAEKTILMLICHQTMTSTTWIQSTEVSNHYTTGTRTVVDTGSFTKNGKYFICTKNGTVYVLGSISCAGGSPSVSIYKNDVSQQNNGTYQKLDFVFNVVVGDKLSFSCYNPEAWWWNQAIIVIF